MVRPDEIITHKCYGGYGVGKAVMEHVDAETDRKKFNVYHLTKNLTRVGLDVLRGPGNKWQFVWVLGLGIIRAMFGGAKAKEVLHLFGITSKPAYRAIDMRCIDKMILAWLRVCLLTTTQYWSSLIRYSE